MCEFKCTYRYLRTEFCLFLDRSHRKGSIPYGLESQTEVYFHFQDIDLVPPTQLRAWLLITRNSALGFFTYQVSVGEARLIRRRCLTVSGRAVAQDGVQACRKRRGLPKNASVRTDDLQRCAPWGDSVGYGGTEAQRPGGRLISEACRSHFFFRKPFTAFLK